MEGAIAADGVVTAATVVIAAMADAIVIVAAMADAAVIVAAMADTAIVAAVAMVVTTIITVMAPTVVTAVVAVVVVITAFMRILEMGGMPMIAISLDINQSAVPALLQENVSLENVGVSQEDVLLPLEIITSYSLVDSRRNVKFVLTP